MKTLLIYPRFDYPNAGGVQEPLGILYLAAALERAGHEAEILDLSFLASIPDLAPRLDGVGLVGISSSTALFGRAAQTLRAIKAIAPNLPVVAGGPHATAMPEDAVNAGFDAAVIGEGEISVVELANAIGERHGLDGVSGLARIVDGKLRVSESPPFVRDLDSLPHPDRSRIDYPKYFAAGLKQAGIVAMRGCPFHCSYCKPMQDKLFGRKIRRRSARDVAVEVDSVARNVIDRVLFRDDAFTTMSVEWFDEFAATTAELRTPLWGWVCQGRVDQITPKLLDAMQRAGLKMIAFGVESGSQRVLDFYRKGIKPEQTERAFAMCRERGIGTHAFIMIGAPVETTEDIEATIRLLERIKPNSVSPSIATPAPGTDLYDFAVKNGLYAIRDWAESDYMSNSNPMLVPGLTVEQIAKARETIATMGVGYGAEE